MNFTGETSLGAANKNQKGKKPHHRGHGGKSERKTKTRKPIKRFKPKRICFALDFFSCPGLDFPLCPPWLGL
jgi:hypothetical protein